MGNATDRMNKCRIIKETNNKLAILHSFLVVVKLAVKSIDC